MAKMYQVVGTPFDGTDLPKVSPEDNGKVLRVVDGEWKADDLPLYDGAYEVTPSADDQTLYTAQKLLDADIKVKKIPYSEVSNTANGTTVIIGREV